MRVKLQGLFRTRKRLADGTTKEYFYAWRGGPRLFSDFGTPAFVEEFNSHHGNKKKPDPSVFLSVIRDYEQSTEYADLAPRTRADYSKQLRRIEDKFGKMPLSSFDDVRITRSIKNWHKKLECGDRQADYALQVLSATLNWALAEGLISYRLPKMKFRNKSDRSGKIWLDEDGEKFYEAAPPELKLAYTLAVETGQRQGDLIRLRWDQLKHDSKRNKYYFDIRQRKRGRGVKIPLTTRLALELEKIEDRTGTVLKNSFGQPWDEKANGFRNSWRAVQHGRKDKKGNVIKPALKLSDMALTFNDLRGTAVTRLLNVDPPLSIVEIASITGHSLKTAQAILDHYWARDGKAAFAAIEKLDRAKA